MAITTSTQKSTLLEETLQQLPGSMPGLGPANQPETADADAVRQKFRAARPQG